MKPSPTEYAARAAAALAASDPGFSVGLRDKSSRSCTCDGLGSVLLSDSTGREMDLLGIGTERFRPAFETAEPISLTVRLSLAAGANLHHFCYRLDEGQRLVHLCHLDGQPDFGLQAPPAGLLRWIHDEGKLLGHLLTAPEVVVSGPLEVLSFVDGFIGAPPMSKAADVDDLSALLASVVLAATAEGVFDV